MLNLPTIRQLQYLLAVKNAGSFHKAAEQCNVSQSTLSAGIQELERILEYPVLNRTTRSVRLTPLGEDLVRESDEILARLKALTQKARSLQSPFSMPVRMGVIPTIAPYLLPKIVPPLQNAFPDLDLHITEAQSAELVNDLHNDNLDVLLMAFPYDMKGVQIKIIREEPFYVAAPAGYFKNRKTLKLSDLEGEKLLLLEDGHCLRDHALSACNLQPESARKTFRAASLPTLIQMTAQGYGLTLLPEMVVHQGFLPETVDILPFAKPVPTRQIGLAWPDKTLLSEEIDLISRKIQSTLKD